MRAQTRLKSTPIARTSHIRTRSVCVYSLCQAQIKTLEGELNKLHARGKKRRKRASVLGRKARALKRRDEQAWKEVRRGASREGHQGCL